MASLKVGTRPGRSFAVRPLAAFVAGALLLTGCAGQAGGKPGGGEGAGDGVPYGASLDEFKEALSDMPETTLVYQPTESSPNGLAAARALASKENVEEGSGGKIVVDLVWGQAIAGFSELPDALVDGRVDIAYTLPMYQPTEYPVTNAFVTATSLTGSSPREGDLVANAAMLDLAWKSESLIEEFESKGLNVLMPFHADGNVLTMCTDPGVDSSAWKGRQVRIASSAQEDQVKAISGSPVSMEYVETYEGLQRGTIDCTLSAGVVAVGNGFMEIAPHFSYSENASFARGAGAIMAGSSFDQLPLAAQQLIFDQMQVVFEKGREVSLQGNIEAAKAAKAQGIDRGSRRISGGGAYLGFRFPG